jgi:DNA-binding PadR family transcriptional regulator
MRHFLSQVFAGHALHRRHGHSHNHDHVGHHGGDHHRGHDVGSQRENDHLPGQEHAPRARHCHGGDRHGDGRGHGAGRGHGGGRAPDGGGNFMRGRKFSSDDLQLLLLALLAERPSHGYELIKALHTRTEGFYSPSPGMVYPALTYIEELGYANVTLDSNKKSYSLAPEGVAYLASMKTRVEELFAGLAHMAQKMKYLRGALSEDGTPEDNNAGWLPIFVEARRALKRALLMKSEAGHDEQQRIAAILARATDEINAN